MKKLLSAMIVGMTLTVAQIAQAQESPLRPHAGEDLGTARAKCTKLSNRAARDNVQVLVIGYEGLASYSPGLVSAAYQINEVFRRGNKTDEVPGGMGMTGFMTRGFFIPMLLRHGNQVEVLIYPNGAAGHGSSVADACAQAWLQAGGHAEVAAKRKVVIVGHSFGGHAAHQLASSMQRQGLKVDAVFTMDPRSKGTITVSWRKTPNVRLWNNFFQKMGGLSGFPVGGARNVDLTGRAAHVSIPNARQVRMAFSNYLKEAIQ